MALSIGEQIERLLQPIKSRIASMIVCAIVRSISDGTKLQTLKVSMMEDQTKDDVDHIQQFGFTSHPPKGSEAVVLFVGGNRSHGVVIGTDSSTYRLKGLPEGAVALYNQNGDYVKLTSDKIEVHANEINLGKANFKKLINEEFQSMFNTHVHHYIDSVGPPATPTPKLTGKPGALLATGTPSIGGSTGSPTGLNTYAISATEMTSKTKAE